MPNIKRQVNERRGTVLCDVKRHDSGIDMLLELCDEDPLVSATVSLFGIETSNVVVVLCNNNNVPVTGEELSSVLEFTSNTGGAPPRAYHGNKWKVMPLGELQSIEHRCIFYFLQPFGNRTSNEKKINEFLPSFGKWSFSRIARPMQVGNQYVPGTPFDINLNTIVDMELAVLNDAIEANDARLACVMVHSIHNRVEICEMPRLENPMDPGYLADNLATAIYTRQSAVSVSDYATYDRLRATTHPWDWFCALRLIVCGMAICPTGLESSAALYERSVMENRNNIVLSMLFDGKGMKDVITPFFLMRILTDNVRTTDSVMLHGTSVDEVTVELLHRAEAKLPQLRASFLVLSVSSLSRMSLWNVHGAQNNLHEMHENSKRIGSVPDAVLAMYPEVHTFSDNLHYIVANLVLKGASLSRKGMNGKMITPELLLTPTVPLALLGAVQSRMDTQHTTVLETVQCRESAPTWPDFKKYLEDKSFRLTTGAVETVRVVYNRLALEVMSGGTVFVRAALQDEAFFISRRTMNRFLRPLLGAPYSDSVLRGCEDMREKTETLARTTAEERSTAFGIPMNDQGYCVMSTAQRHPLKAEVHRTFKTAVLGATCVAKKPLLDLSSVSAIDAFSMTKLREQIQKCVALADDIHACPICFETDKDMIHVHTDKPHPDDYKVCTTCRAQLRFCPFCRVGLW